MKIPVFAVVVDFFFLKVQPCDLPPKRAVLDMRNFTPAYMNEWTYVRTIFAEPKLLGCIDNQISYPWCFASRSLRARGHRYKIYIYNAVITKVSGSFGEVKLLVQRCALRIKFHLIKDQNALDRITSDRGFYEFQLVLLQV